MCPNTYLSLGATAIGSSSPTTQGRREKKQRAAFTGASEGGKGAKHRSWRPPAQIRLSLVASSSHSCNSSPPVLPPIFIKRKKSPKLKPFLRRFSANWILGVLSTHLFISFWPRNGSFCEESEVLKTE